MTLDAETEIEPAAMPRPPSARERADRIYRILRDRICLLEYAPGSLISEEELAQEFEVSRTPVRRVLGRLESEGLVQSVHGVGVWPSRYVCGRSSLYSCRNALNARCCAASVARAGRMAPRFSVRCMRCASARARRSLGDIPGECADAGCPAASTRR